MHNKQPYPLSLHIKHICILLASVILVMDCQNHIATDDAITESESDEEVLDRLATLKLRGKQVRFVEEFSSQSDDSLGFICSSLNRRVYSPVGKEVGLLEEAQIRNSLIDYKLIKKQSNRNKELKRQLAQRNQELAITNQELAKRNQELLILQDKIKQEKEKRLAYQVEEERLKIAHQVVISEVVRNLLLHNVDLKQIENITGLSAAQIESINPKSWCAIN